MTLTRHRLGNFNIGGTLTVAGSLSVTGSYGLAMTDLPDGALDMLAYGSGNAAWIPCTMVLADPPTAVEVDATATYIQNTGADDFEAAFRAPLPTMLGTLKLYITGIRIAIYNADGSNYIDNVSGQKGKYNAQDTFANDAINKTAQADYTNTFTAEDCSTYRSLWVRIACVASTVGDLEFGPVEVRYYYA